jgi:uncharacterized cupredoxin-like copper-binding protein
VVLAGTVAGGVGGAAFSLAGRAAGEGSGVRTEVVVIHHSRFSPATISVPAGREVRFVIRNTDPIDHEFIVGPPEVHDRHERGTEARHGAVPGEVSVPAMGEAETTYLFRAPGPMVFACHLPGHLAYGMHGVVVAS